MAPKRHYNSHQMLNAIEAVKKGSKLLTAAKTFGVPRITLRNKIIGKSPIICGMGPPSILTEEQECIFVQWLNDMSDKHCPVGKEHLLDSVQQFVIRKKIINPFTNNRPGKKWFYSFLKRHPGISERISQNFFKSKDDISQEKLESWFSNIYEYLQKKKLQEAIKDPRRVFTSDEAAFYLNPKLNRVLVERSASNIYSVIANKKDNPRVFLTANAAGQLAPPMVMFADQCVDSYIDDSIPEGWGIGTSKTGWMCGITLYEYMTKIFHPWLIEKDITLPVIYFLDGDATHLTYHLSEFCSKNQIELLALYPNSTKILKTMDVALFRPLRVFWKKECNMWKNRNCNHLIKKENIGPILEKALKAVTPVSIQNGFKVGGLFPFGYTNIDVTQLKTAKIVKTEPNPNDLQFFNTLEKEIVVNFTQKTLELFNARYRHKTAINLPKEDETLYTIWSKYKDKCQDIVDKVGLTDDNTFPHASPEYEIGQDNMFIKISQTSFEFENDLEAAHSEDSEKSYESLDTEYKPTKHLPSIAATRDLLQSNSKESPVKMTRLRISGKRTVTKNSKPVARTIRELREFNKKQLKAMLEQQQVIKQESIGHKTKRGEKDIQMFKRQKRNIKKEIITSSEDTTESETSLIEYESDESKVSHYLKEEPKEIVKYDLKETQDKQLSTLDIVKKEIENENVVICVNDNDVYIMY